MHEEYYTIPEVMKKLKVSRATVYKYIRDGELQTVVLGTRGPQRVPGSSLESFIRRKEDIKSGNPGAMQQVLVPPVA